MPGLSDDDLADFTGASLGGFAGRMVPQGSYFCVGAGIRSSAAL